MSRIAKYLAAGSVAALALSPVGSSIAQETAGSPIQVTVQNAFTFTETQALSFGTISAVNDSVDTTAYAIDEAGVVTAPTNPGAALIYAFTTPTEGTFTISGAAPNTPINVTLPASSVTLTYGGCSATCGEFSVGSFVTDAAGVVPNLSVTTDGTGAAAFALGATLSTIASANPFEDGVYSAAFTITANY